MIPFEIIIIIYNECSICNNNKIFNLVSDVFFFVTLIICLLTIKYLSSYNNTEIAKNVLIFIYGMLYILKGIGFAIKFDCNYNNCADKLYYTIYYLYVMGNSLFLLFLQSFLIIKYFCNRKKPLINEQMYVNL